MKKRNKIILGSVFALGGVIAIIWGFSETIGIASQVTNCQEANGAVVCKRIPAKQSIETQLLIIPKRDNGNYRKYTIENKTGQEVISFACANTITTTKLTALSNQSGTVNDTSLSHYDYYKRMAGPDGRTTDEACTDTTVLGEDLVSNLAPILKKSKLNHNSNYETIYSYIENFDSDGQFDNSIMGSSSYSQLSKDDTHDGIWIRLPQKNEEISNDDFNTLSTTQKTIINKYGGNWVQILGIDNDASGTPIRYISRTINSLPKDMFVPFRYPEEWKNFVSASAGYDVGSNKIDPVIDDKVTICENRYPVDEQRSLKTTTNESATDIPEMYGCEDCLKSLSIQRVNYNKYGLAYPTPQTGGENFGLEITTDPATLRGVYSYTAYYRTWPSSGDWIKVNSTPIKSARIIDVTAPANITYQFMVASERTYDENNNTACSPVLDTVFYYYQAPATYEWDAKAWGSCTSEVVMGGGTYKKIVKGTVSRKQGTRSRTVNCVDTSNSNNVVNDSNCSATKPTTSEDCEPQYFIVQDTGCHKCPIGAIGNMELQARQMTFDAGFGGAYSSIAYSDPNTSNTLWSWNTTKSYTLSNSNKKIRYGYGLPCELAANMEYQNTHTATYVTGWTNKGLAELKGSGFPFQLSPSCELFLVQYKNNAMGDNALYDLPFQIRVTNY